MKTRIWQDRVARSTHQVLRGDVRKRLRDVPSRAAHVCITSPPYWGVRDNGSCDCVVDGRTDVWDNGRKGRSRQGGAVSFFRHGIADPNCRNCKGTGFIRRYTRSQIGGELDPNDYIENMVLVGREIRRVLHPTGTWWLNIGDCHAGEHGSMRNSAWIRRIKGQLVETPRLYRKTGRAWGSLKYKDLVMMPQRISLALQDDGWFLFSAIVWHKLSVSPGSERHRPTHSYEMIYYLSKSVDPFYDWFEAREPAVGAGGRRPGLGVASARAANFGAGRGYRPTGDLQASTRNLRDVWVLPGRANQLNHTSTFPPSLPERCIRIGTSAAGACKLCGAPHVRVVGKVRDQIREQATQLEWRSSGKGRRVGGINDGNHPAGVDFKHKGWRPTCEHKAPLVPCVVLDPFAGSGTTAAVAAVMGRSSISIELRDDHAATIMQRVATARLEETIA